MKDFANAFINVRDGEKIFYSTNFSEIDSHRPLLVFNYGLVCSNHHWHKQTDAFAAKGYQILLHDYRGHYQSTGKERVSSITFENIVEDLNEIFNKLKIKNAILLGHSMGVNICLEFTRRYPQKVQKLVLISGTAVPVDNIMFHSNIMEHLKPKLLNLLQKYKKTFEILWATSEKNPLVKKIIHMGGFNTDQVSKEFIDIYVSKLGKIGPEIFFQLIGQMQTSDILSFVPSIKQKTLIIGGNNDKVIPNYLQRFLAEQIDQSELYIVYKGSHVPQVDFPDLVNERIEIFLQETSSYSRPEEEQISGP